MIYTSYFAKLRSLPDYIVPISICGKAPEWYQGLQYKKLAPFMEWKRNKDNNFYIKYFQEQVLDNLNPIDVALDLSKRAYGNIGEKDIALICYEKPSDFCHRHLVADWFNKNGVCCKELVF